MQISIRQIAHATPLPGMVSNLHSTDFGGFSHILGSRTKAEIVGLN